MYPLESTQCLARSFYIIVFLQIDLHNLFTVTFAGIGYGDTQSQFLTGLYIIRTKHHSTIAERGIAQSMTEGKKRFLGHVTVSPAGHVIILKIRELRHIAVEGHWQASCRIVIAEQYFGYSRTACLTGIPCLQNGSTPPGFRLQTDGRTRTVHQHHLFAGTVQGGNQFPLDSRQLDIGTVTSSESGKLNTHLLAFEVRRDSSHKDHDISILYTLHRFPHIHFILKSKVEVQLCIATEIFKIQFNVIHFSCLYLQSISTLLPTVLIGESSHFLPIYPQSP